jgi:putative nucleotide binding protein
MKQRDSKIKQERKKPRVKKRILGQVFVLDFYPQGKSLSRKYADDFNPLVVVITADHFQFFDVVLKRGENIVVGDSFTISSSRPNIFKIKKIGFNQLSDSAVNLLPEIVQEIVKVSEARFIRFLNHARPLTSQMHQLQLIPGIGNKRLWQILEARKKSPFQTFEDFKDRTGISDPILAFTNRIINEINEEEKYLLFTEKQK